MAKEEPVKERVLGDVAAEWQVNLPDGIHHVEIEHGTTSGKRVIRVDEKEVCATAVHVPSHVLY